MIWLLYRVLTWLVAPLIWGRVFIRLLQEPGYRANWAQRFGYRLPDSTGPVLWMHAVSVGEVNVAVELIEGLLARVQHPILLTTTTITGAARARFLLGDRVIHCYAPFDFKSCVVRFIEHFKPIIGLFIETELWPHWIYYCAQYRVPTMLINGRLSERAFSRYQKAQPLIERMLLNLSVIVVQTERIKQRFEALGASQTQLYCANNIKYDMRVDPSQKDQGQQKRQLWGASRPCLIAASTHPGEEAKVLEAFTQVQRQIKDACLLLAPRHPVRTDELIELCETFKFQSVRASQCLDQAVQHPDIVIVDVLGELCLFYAAADVAFIGGSLIEHGGHNPIEPAQLACACVSGEHVFNFEEVYARLYAEGGCVCIKDADTLAEAWLKILQDEAFRTSLMARAHVVVQSAQGGILRHIELIERLLASGYSGSSKLSKPVLTL